MATLSLTYYARLAEDVHSHTIMVGEEPALKREVVTYTSATLSQVFPENARFVEIVPSADAYLDFGENPVATAASSRYVKDVAKFVGIAKQRQSNYRLSAYDGTT
jgi:hypothetical protein